MQRHTIAEKFSQKYSNEFKILHINMNSLYYKFDWFFEILDSNKYGLLFINESKLNVSIPDASNSQKNNSCYRRDRDYVTATVIDKKDGGIFIYIRKKYVRSVQNSFESIHLSLIIKNAIQTNYITGVP